MKPILAFIAPRLRERSTWLGVVAFASLIGITISPEMLEAMLSGGLFVAGLIGVLTKDSAPE
jgi:hypothetical protein